MLKKHAVKSEMEQVKMNVYVCISLIYKAIYIYRCVLICSMYVCVRSLWTKRMQWACPMLGVFQVHERVVSHLTSTEYTCIKLNSTSSHITINNINATLKVSVRRGALHYNIDIPTFIRLHVTILGRNSYASRKTTKLMIHLNVTYANRHFHLNN